MKTEKLCYDSLDYNITADYTAGIATISNANKNSLVSAANDAKNSVPKKVRLIHRDTDTAAGKQQSAIRSLIDQVAHSCKNMNVDPERYVVASYDYPILVPLNPKIKLVPLVNGTLPSDFVDIGSIKFMPPVSDFWVKLNNLNKNIVDEHYDRHSKIDDYINSIPGFIPPGAASD